MDEQGRVVASTTTGQVGRYRFKGLSPGVYGIAVDVSALPDGLVPSADYDGSETPDIAVFSLVVGEENLLIDFGYAEEAAGTSW